MPAQTLSVVQVLVTWINREREGAGRWGAQRLAASYLSSRLDLFERLTVPSVAAQSVGGFWWVLLLDPATPEPFRRRLEAGAHLERGRVLMLFNDGEEASTLAPLKAAAAAADAVLVSRLDNDDCLHRDALERVREYFLAHPEDCEVLNFETGFFLDVESGRLSLARFSSPPFSTRVWRRPVADPLDHGPAHETLPSLYKYHAIDRGQPYFVVSVHNRNVANTLPHTASPLSRSLSRQILENGFGVEARVTRVPLRSYRRDALHLAWQILRDRREQP